MKGNENPTKKAEVCVSGLDILCGLDCTFINLRPACAARVTVVVLSFCLSVCLLSHFLPLRATRRPISNTNGFSATLAFF